MSFSFRRSLQAALVLLLAPGTAGPAAAQVVSGQVLEQESGVAVAGATVSLRQAGSPGGASVLTDSAGRFTLRRAPRSGAYVFRVTHPSYAAFEDRLRLQSDESVTLRVQLGREAIPLEPLVVTARSQRRLQGYYDRLNHGTGSGRFLTREQLDNIPANRVTDYLRRVPAITLERVEGGSLITIDNPLGRCTPLIYIDGVPVEQQGGDLVDDFLTPTMLEGIEFYAGTVGMPLEFASAQQTGCGVVAFWTQDAAGRSVTWLRLLIAAAGAAAFIITSLKIML